VATAINPDETLEFGVRETDAGWVAFHEFKVDSVPHLDEEEAAASRAVAIRRLIELLNRIYPQDAGEEGSAK